ncbi:MAG: GMC family oxidoreductase [Burkholderiales bacterium]|nr:GMC family oxidoreductase [Burkholderiales bacterium]
MTASNAVIIADPIVEGLARGWKVVDAARLERDLVLDADVVVVGTGAGGGTAAEILAASGASVVLLEEGPLRSSRDFSLHEATTYPALYQDSAARKTRDQAITILQGRCVGGGTTVNWTSSFRTPVTTLDWWRREYGLADVSAAAMAPWFERMEERLSIAPWPVTPNANNAALARGAAALGIATATMQRNVKGCWNLGYCDLGCPTNAKQSMLVTTLPAALDRGATLVTQLRADRLTTRADAVSAVEGHAIDPASGKRTARRVTVRARAFVCAAGAIGTPGLLLRSDLPDPHDLVGRRTFLHPVVLSAAAMPEIIDGFAGAPQSLYSDHFQENEPLDGRIGFKLEVPPLHPLLTAVTLSGDGEPHARWMHDYRHLHVVLALLRDGFHPHSPGGRVQLRSDGTPVLDYPLTPYLFDGMRRAFLAMARIQFAAGAQRVAPGHGHGLAFTSLAQAEAAIAAFPLAPLATRVVSAHVMGGAPFGPDPRRAVVDPAGRHHHLQNLCVCDGSIFPTSIGANPQLSIYAFAARIATALAHGLG